MEIRRLFVRASLVAFGLVLVASAAAAFRGTRPSNGFTLPPPLPREWRWEARKALDLEFMYQKPERPPLELEDMYAKRRFAE